ncbi:MAG: type IV secretion system DNA-binding domain-containing protein [Alphaproteobacteria bacterium]|nr:type IV secretion system DNA-binding domain-containing protein [Alphaproteobacteria bacterium]NCQ67119.1 type IV secretion system DNA-binding domain-containing protein [Alphaproteobacteria bacterium]NCT07716.1 type IV secretion system DNA-binding domain-containing protein [Alphaproteobacteria bacterium]
MAKNLVRGGQLHIHNLRMIKQVLSVGLVVSFLIGGSVLAWKTWNSIPSYILRQYLSSYQAEFILPYKSDSMRHRFMVSWPDEYYTQKVRAIDIIHHPYTHNMRSYVEDTIKKQVTSSINVTIICLLLLMLFWGLKGRKSLKSKRLRGQRLVSSFRLKWMIKLRRKASHLKVEKLPLIKNSETKHILAVGTTGSGKTNLYNDLLPQIAKEKQRSFVIDTTGDMISKYYNPDRGDVILNPFDGRSAKWDIIHECSHEYQFDHLAKSIVPKNGEHSDPLWQNGSAKLFSVGLQKAQQRDISPKELHRILIKSSLKEFGAFFWGTDAYPFADPAGERTTLSFRSTLSSSVQFLKHLGKGEKSFSLSDWIRDESKENWIFVTANEDMLHTLNPLIAAVFNSASTFLMSQSESKERCVWFIMDELPAIQKLQSLQALLSKGRKYGACLFAGLQSMSQFDEIYGHNGSKTILNLFNTKFFFRSEESKACEQISKWLGEEEIEEAKESLSYGAHQMRDGISLNQQKSRRRLVLPTEVAQLPDLTCYLKFPGKFPISKLKMSYHDRKSLHSSFDLKN